VDNREGARQQGWMGKKKQEEQGDEFMHDYPGSCLGFYAKSGAHPLILWFNQYVELTERYSDTLSL
jgi:hypothetical protein